MMGIVPMRDFWSLKVGDTVRHHAQDRVWKIDDISHTSYIKDKNKWHYHLTPLSGDRGDRKILAGGTIRNLYVRVEDETHRSNNADASSNS